MNWLINLVLLGTAYGAVLAGEDISSESPTFPKMEEIESVFKRSFENVLYTESLDGLKTRSEDARSKEMPQDDLSYLEHGFHPGNADVWKLHRVWKAMETVKRNLPQILSSNNDPRTMATIRNLCERHAREEMGVDFEELNCDPNQEYRSINGTCNNLKNTRWGSAPQPFERFLPADYGDDLCNSNGGSTVAGQCLILYEDPKTWTEAVASCEAKGQRLAVLQDPVAVNVWLQNNYAGKYIWLGASDTAIEGKWVWINGVPAQSVWTSSQPNNDANQDCLAWGWLNNYDDGWCYQSHPYICELDESWSVIRNACIEGHKYKHLSGLTIEACKQMCKEDGRGCKSISYHISTSTCRFSQLGSISGHYSQPCYRPGHDFYEYIERVSIYNGPYDNTWNADQCGHIKYHHGVTSLSLCKLGCSQEKNCNAFNYNQHKQGCSLKACSVPIPDPLSTNKYEGYAYDSGSWSGPYHNVWNDDQCELIGGWGGDGGFSLSGCQALCLRKPNCNAVNWNPHITRCEPRICPLPVPKPNYKRGYFGYSLSSGGSALRRSKKDEELPNARKISRSLSDSQQREQPKVSLMLMQWGQFLDHDITETPTRELENEDNGSDAIMCCSEGKFENSVRLLEDCLPIDVRGDDYYQSDNRDCIRFVRSMPAAMGCAHSPMEQINANTAFVDGSMVYGSSTTIAASLRTNSRGLLKTTTHNGNGQPLPPKGSPTARGPLRCPQAESMYRCFLAGDIRVDEIPGLTALHTTFIRLHNIIAEELAILNPYWAYDDEKLYQETRRIVIALIQQTTYRDWLPHVVGPSLIEEHRLKTGRFGYRDSYNPDVNPTMRNVFATAAFRFGHTLVAEDIKGASPAMELPLRGRFFNITTIESDETSPSSLLKGLTRCPAQPIDTVVVETLTNSLFASNASDDGNFYGLDLVSLNIQRGRDHGIPSYREWRKFCGLEDLTDFEDLKKVMPDKLAETFKQTYHDIDDIDLFPAGLAENSIADGILGPTFSCIIARQFADTKHGDRFWYEREYQPKKFTPEQLSSIRSQGLVSILCRVSEHTSFKFQPDPFLVADDYGNKEMRCSSYKFMNLRPWKEY